MFKQIKVWKITCQKCGKVYSSGDNSEDYFLTKKEAIEDIEHDGWWKIKDGKAYCEVCFVFR